MKEEELRMDPSNGGFAHMERQNHAASDSSEEPPDLYTVMVVEDNPTNIKLLKEILKRMKCATVEARDGAMALSMLEGMDKLPDIMLTDIMMPNMDGITLIKWLRHMPRYDNMPIIVVSAFAAEVDIKAAIEAGSTGYLTKPLQIRPFMDMLSAYLKG
jgi:CheY-like chemotaxis protein